MSGASAGRAESDGGNWFIAWPLDCPPLARALPPAGEGLGLLAPQDWHVTAVFLGAVEPAQAQAAWRRASADPPAAVRVDFAGLATAGRSRAPAYVLTLGAGREVCVDWMRRQQTAIAAAAGIAPPLRAPWPHLTLARPRRAAAVRLEAWAVNRPYAGLSVVLDRLALFGRRQDSGPGRYAIVASMQLERTE